jgi:hypothetical protein
MNPSAIEMDSKRACEEREREQYSTARIAYMNFLLEVIF